MHTDVLLIRTYVETQLLQHVLEYVCYEQLHSMAYNK